MSAHDQILEGLHSVESLGSAELNALAEQVEAASIGGGSWGRAYHDHVGRLIKEINRLRDVPKPCSARIRLEVTHTDETGKVCHQEDKTVLMEIGDKDFLHWDDVTTASTVVVQFEITKVL